MGNVYQSEVFNVVVQMAKYFHGWYLMWWYSGQCISSGGEASVPTLQITSLHRLLSHVSMYYTLTKHCNFASKTYLLVAFVNVTKVYVLEAKLQCFW